MVKWKKKKNHSQ